MKSSHWKCFEPFHFFSQHISSKIEWYLLLSSSEYERKKVDIKWKAKKYFYIWKVYFNMPGLKEELSFKSIILNMISVSGPCFSD